MLSPVFFKTLESIIDYPTGKERDVQRMFVQGLASCEHTYYRIANESIARIGGHGYYQTEKSLGFQKGVADLEVMVDNQLIKVEIKKARKKKTGYFVPKPLPEQAVYLKAIQDCGLYAFILATPQDFIMFFDKEFDKLQEQTQKMLN